MSFRHDYNVMTFTVTSKRHFYSDIDGLLQQSFKCLNYRLYKTEHKFENYLNSIGDEFHYVFQCPFFSPNRKLFLPNIKPGKANGMFFFSNVFNETNIPKLKKLCSFMGKNLKFSN